MIVCHSLPGPRSRRRTGGKSKGLPEREGRREEKRLFFDTSEATILLKRRVESFEKGQNELLFRHKFAPKCTPKSRFLPIRDLICTWRGPNYRGLHGVSSLFQRAEVPGVQEKMRTAKWPFRPTHSAVSKRHSSAHRRASLSASRPCAGRPFHQLARKAAAAVLSYAVR